MRLTVYKSRGLVLALAALALLLTAACYNNNTGETNIQSVARFTLPAFPETGSHAVLTFTEMHYSPSYRVQESPRLLPPLDSVPVTGKRIIYTSSEYPSFTVPAEVRASYDAAEAADLFRVNCMVCHGQSMTGDGTMRDFLTRGAAPADLMRGPASTATEGSVFAWISFGGQPGFAMAMIDRESPTVMPQFYQLMTDEEIWTLVMYLKQQSASFSQ
ncbi:MAG: cytochrome c [Chloroflexi bacterium]|nr:cytochrome c [Chloroflexota bacterium]